MTAPVPNPAGPCGTDDPREELIRLHDSLREALIAYFRRMRVPDPEEQANEVFLRVLQKARRGLRIKRSLGQFCWRVARFVALEQYRQKRFNQIGDEVPRHERAVLGLQDIEFDILLQECMTLLSARDLEFVRRYLHDDKEALARDLKTTTSAMAVRFWKLKKKLEESVRGTTRAVEQRRK